VKVSPERATNRLADDDKHSRSIGYWPYDGMLSFTKSTAIRHVIAFSKEVGGKAGEFQTNIYLTSSNRSNKGTEAHIAFDYDTIETHPLFVVFDWSMCIPQRARQVPIKQMDKWVSTVTVNNIKLSGVLVINETRWLRDTTWANCVYLGVFDEDEKLKRFDLVYSNVYALICNDEQKPGCNGFWGPELETFQDYSQPINPMGFTGCWMIQD